MAKFRNFKVVQYLLFTNGKSLLRPMHCVQLNKITWIMLCGGVRKATYETRVPDSEGRLYSDYHGDRSFELSKLLPGYHIRHGQTCGLMFYCNQLFRPWMFVRIPILSLWKVIKLPYHPHPGLLCMNYCGRPYEKMIVMATTRPLWLTSITGASVLMCRHILSFFQIVLLIQILSWDRVA